MRTSRKWLLGFLIWTVLGLLSVSQHAAFLAYMGQHRDLGKLFARTMLDWYTCAVFTPAIFVVARRFPLHQPGWLRRLPAHILACIAYIVLKFALFLPIAGTLGLIEGDTRLQAWVLGDAFALLISYAAIVAVVYGIDYYTQFRERSMHAAALESRLAHAQLDAIRAQLHPHFLFNALNALSTLIHRDAQAADKMLLELSELLRHVLYSDPATEVPLRVEMSFVERYLRVMQTRLGDRMHVSVSVAPDVENASIPNLLLQPIVENAVLHGIAKSSRAGELAIRSFREADRLVVEVMDDGPGLKPETASRIGLRNTRLLLEQLYGANQSLEVRNRDGRGAIARLTLPFRMAE